MTSQSTRGSRLDLYSRAATVAAIAAGTTGTGAVADVTSGTFNFSFGRTAGTGFFNNMSASGTYGSVYKSVAMGDLSMYFNGFLASYYADAVFAIQVSSSSGSSAIWNQKYLSISGSYGSSTVYGADWANAGQNWVQGSHTTTWLSNQIFFTYYSSFTGGSGTTATWTNPDLGGTQYLNFFIEGGDGDIYGWIQFDWNITDADDWSVSVSNWAYSDDGPLAAGDTTGTPAVPGLGGLAALAMGAAGVRGRRQRMAG